MFGTISASGVDNAFLMIVIGSMCFLSQFALVVGFVLVMIASGKWDEVEEEEKVCETSADRARHERLFRKAGYDRVAMYHDPERANKLVLVFQKRRIKLFKDML